jgi:hypothetical protein
MHNNYYDRDACNELELGQNLKKAAAKQLLDVDNDLKATGLNCAHVIFENLTAQPIEVVRSIYQQFGWEFTEEYEQILVDYLEKNRKQRAATSEKLKKSKLAKGKTVTADKLHDYKPEDFGLTKKELSEGRFLEYIKRYNITSDK